MGHRMSGFEQDQDGVRVEVKGPQVPALTLPLAGRLAGLWLAVCIIQVS